MYDRLYSFLEKKESFYRHFADDTNLLFGNNKLKINKYINHDLAPINKWVRANKISLNQTKTEIIIFRAKNKRITEHLNFQISGQEVKLCTKVRYLGIILQEHIEWNTPPVS